GVATDGPSLLEFFRKRTVDGDDREHIQKLIKELGSEDFETREVASGKLAALGARAKPLLKAAPADPDVEISRRPKECLEKIDQGSSAQAVAAAARVVAQRKPDKAVEVLLAYLPSAEDPMVAQEVCNTLGALALKDGKADPALVAALTDKSAAKRAAAAVALAHAKASDELPVVRKLLRDPDPAVRARVGLALVELREKEAIPALIEVLGQVPPYDNARVEALLYRLADDKAPTVEPGKDDAGRKKYREAWKAWWDEHGSKADVAKLEEASKALGYTLV